MAQAEELMGEAFKKLGWKREDFVVSTKVGMGWRLGFGSETRALRPRLSMRSSQIFFGAGNSSPNAKGLSRKHLIEGTRGRLREDWDVAWSSRSRVSMGKHCTKS